MPSMANITVKKADGTTDIVYDALSSSGGDSSPAVWRQDTGAATSLPVGLRAKLTCATGNNGPRTARTFKLSFVRPYVFLDVNGLESSKDRVVMDLNVTLPQAIPQGELAEAVYQGFNLVAATLIKQSANAGYAPT